MPDAGGKIFGQPSGEPGAPEKPKSAIAQPLGPLPVWGWGVVAVAAVFLWRRIAGGGAAASKSQPQAANYPQGGVGGVFLLPGQGAAPAPSPGAPPTAAGIHVTPDVLRSLGHSLIEHNNTVNPQPVTPEGAAFLSNLAGNYGAQDFITQNVARKALGLPYVVGAGSWGAKGVMDPTTGHVSPLP